MAGVALALPKASVDFLLSFVMTGEAARCFAASYLRVLTIFATYALTYERILTGLMMPLLL